VIGVRIHKDTTQGQCLAGCSGCTNKNCTCIALFCLQLF